jgi:hypothetical protein
MLWGTINTL